MRKSFLYTRHAQTMGHLLPFDIRSRQGFTCAGYAYKALDSKKAESAFRFRSVMAFAAGPRAIAQPCRMQAGKFTVFLSVETP